MERVYVMFECATAPVYLMWNMLMNYRSFLFVCCYCFFCDSFSLSLSLTLFSLFFCETGCARAPSRYSFIVIFFLLSYAECLSIAIFSKRTFGSSICGCCCCRSCCLFYEIMSECLPDRCIA